METLDLTWFDAQEKIERTYDKFYEANVDRLGITLIYIDDKDEVCVTRKESVGLDASTLRRGQLVDILRRGRKLNGCSYALYALMRFNFTSSADSILEGDVMGDHFSVLSNVQDIVFQKCVKALESVNHLYIVMKRRNSSSHTKRVRITVSKRRHTRRSKH